MEFFLCKKGLVVPFFKMPYLYFVFFIKKMSGIKGKNENNNFFDGALHQITLMFNGGCLQNMCPFNVSTSDMHLF
jgi:hypothetical protein